MKRQRYGSDNGGNGRELSRGGAVSEGVSAKDRASENEQTRGQELNESRKGKLERLKKDVQIMKKATLCCGKVDRYRRRKGYG